MKRLITIDAQKGMVWSPKNPSFVSRLKKMGGTWDGGGRVWKFNPALVEDVRELCLKVYGERGDEPNPKYVTLKVEFADGPQEFGGPIVFAGRVIATAYGRDTGADVGEGIAFISGRAKSGGSVKNWTTEIVDGSVVKIFDVPEAFAEAIAAEDVVHISVIYPDPEPISAGASWSDEDEAAFQALLARRQLIRGGDEKAS